MLYTKYNMPSTNGQFGAFLKECRLRKGLTLRAFCRRFGYDPSYISKLERDRVPIPGYTVLGQLARNLGMAVETDEWYQFFDLADAECGRIPPELMEDEELVKKLPILFSGLRGCKDRGKALDDLAERIRRA